MGADGLGRADRVLSSLLTHQRHRDSFIVPASATLDGISRNTRIAVPHVSQVMAKLVARDLVSVRRAHVEGNLRRRNAYFLTERGLQEARLLDGLRPVFHAYPVGLRYPERVVGRGEELGLLTAWFKGGPSTVLYVRGMPGIGKTTLVLDFARSLLGRARVFYFQVYENASSTHLAAELDQFLDECGVRASAGAGSGAPDPGMVAFRFAEALALLPVLLVLDDYHLASPGISSIAGSLSRSIGGPERKLLIAGRTLAEPWGRRAIASGAVSSFQLGGLALDAARSLVADRPLGSSSDAGALETVWRAAEGNPLLMLLAEDADGFTRPGPPTMYIRQELERKLSEASHRILRALSVHDRPVPLEALDPAASPAALEPLLELSVVRGHPGGHYSLHGAVREAVRSGMDAEERERAHAKAAVYYSVSEDPPARLEHVRHSFLAGEFDEARRALAARLRGLLEAGLAHSVVVIAGEMLRKSEAPSLHEIKAEAHFVLGEDLPGVSELRVALKGVRSPGERARMLEHIANTLSRAGDLKGARRAIAAATRASALLGRGREKCALRARLMRDQGHVAMGELAHVRAARCYAASATLARRLKDTELGVACAMNLGVAYYGMGRRRDAVRELRRALRAARRRGDLVSECSVMGNMAAVHFSSGEIDEAMRLNQAILAQAERLGQLTFRCVAAANMAVCLAAREETEAAWSWLGKAREAAAISGDSYWLGFCHNLEARIRLAEGRWEDALRSAAEGLRLAKKLDNRELRMDSMRFRAEAFMESGDLKRARSALTGCIRLLSPGSGRVADSVIGLLLAHLEQLDGRPSRARRLLDRSALAWSEVMPAHLLARARALRAEVAVRMGEFEIARNELRAAADLYARVGSARGVERCRKLGRDLEKGWLQVAAPRPLLPSTVRRRTTASRNHQGSSRSPGPESAGRAR